MDVVPTWGRLSLSRAVAVLRNPTYAGIYAYDRHHPEAMDPEDPCAGGRILIPDSHPGYITESQYERNVARLVSNRSHYRGMRQKGSAREGSCLLTGIVLCGRCGRRMNPRYSLEIDAGVRVSLLGRHVAPARACMRGTWIRRRERDPRNDLEGRALAGGGRDGEARRAIHGAGASVAEGASRRRATRRSERRGATTRWSRRTGWWSERWSANGTSALRELARVEKEYEEARRKPPIDLTAEQRDQILALSKDLPRLFRAPTTKVSQKKEILRLLLEDVTLTNRDDPGESRWRSVGRLVWSAITRSSVPKSTRRPPRRMSSSESRPCTGT